MNKSVQYRFFLVGVVFCTPSYSAELSGFAGLGISASPLYSGSQHIALGPLLTAGVFLRGDKWEGGVSTDGLVWTLVPNDAFTISVLLLQDEGRKEIIKYPFSSRKNNFLQGMGDLPDVFMTGTELGYKNDDWMLWLRALSATQKRQYGGETPGLAMTLESGVKLSLWRWQKADFSVGGDISWANSSYQQRHYGVTKSQSQHTNFNVYSPSSGFQQSGIYSELVWHISENLAAGVTSRAAYLFDESGKSPLVKSRMQYTLSSLIQYEF